jgi:hypothetical protein
MNEPSLVDGVDLVGWDVLEVGRRQAWPFLCLGSPEPERAERRLFIDTDFCVAAPSGAQIEGSALTRLDRLVLLLVTDVRVGGAGLYLRFDDGAELRISGEANATTTHDVWWLGRAS